MLSYYSSTYTPCVRRLYYQVSDDFDPTSRVHIDRCVVIFFFFFIMAMTSRGWMWHRIAGSAYVPRARRVAWTLSEFQSTTY